MIRRAPNHVFPGRQPDMRQLMAGLDRMWFRHLRDRARLNALRADMDAASERLDNAEYRLDVLERDQ